MRTESKQVTFCPKTSSVSLCLVYVKSMIVSGNGCFLSYLFLTSRRHIDNRVNATSVLHAHQK